MENRITSFVALWSCLILANVIENIGGKAFMICLSVIMLFIYLNLIIKNKK